MNRKTLLTGLIVAAWALIAGPVVKADEGADNDAAVTDSITSVGDRWKGAEHASGKLPVMFINTENGDSILDKVTKIPAGLWIEIPEGCSDKQFELGSADEPVSLEIRGRGNSTWDEPKKPYKLKFSKKTAILGMPKHKHFALLAVYGNSLAWAGQLGGMEFARLTGGFSWTPNCQPVELVLNGVYDGLYFLFESIKIDENRLNIYEQPEENTDSTTVPYGWLVEIDNYPDEFQIEVPENPFTADTMRVTHKSPEILSDEQRNWLVDEFTDMCRTIYGTDSLSTPEDWVDYIEPTSMASYFIVREVMTDVDGFNGSMYMHRDIEGDTRWHMGPMWDCNLAAGSGDPYWCMDSLPNWSKWKLIPGIIETENFKKAFMEVWPKFYPEQYVKIKPVLKEMSNRVFDAEVITWERWDRDTNEPKQSQIDYFMDIVNRKAAFMNDYYKSLVEQAGIDEIGGSEAEVVAVKYYSLEGIELPEPRKAGITIRRTTYSDGSVKSHKIYTR